MSATSASAIKRKRQQNTTPEQYEIYLYYMENDYAFRSNIINPTLDPDYLANKWLELAAKLNSIGKGPELTVEEWKMRFRDWKYATNAKFRKICKHAKKTGAGPKINLQMNEIEERALNVWDKVVLGVKSRQFERIESGQSNNITDLTQPDITSDLASNGVIIKKSRPRRKIQNKSNPLSALAETLIKTSEITNIASAELNKTIQKFCDQYISIEKEKLQLEREKFEFEKFKFSNKDIEDSKILI